MGLRDIILGRSKATPPDLDQLFALPAAAVTLQAAMGLAPTGVGSVCFKAAEGGGFTDLAHQVRDLLAVGQDRVSEHTDSYGFTWLTLRAEPDALDQLVTDLHLINSTLADGGFGHTLLCTLVAFTDGSRTAGLVYLYKQGAWYPYAPDGSGRRDSALELQMRGVLDADLRIEPDTSRWFALRDAPGL